MPLRNRNCPTPAKEGTVPARSPPVRVQVVRAGASLEQVVGQDDRPTEPIIVARQQPVRNIITVVNLSALVEGSMPCCMCVFVCHVLFALRVLFSILCHCVSSFIAYYPGTLECVFCALVVYLVCMHASQSFNC